MKKTTLIVAFLPALVFAQQPANRGRDSFVQQQAYAEMQRVSGQMDVLQNNVESLDRRIGKLEGRNEAQTLRVEIDALNVKVNEIRRDLDKMRGEIIRELTAKLVQIQKSQTPPPPPPPKPVVKTYRQYAVQPGDTLSLIAQAFGTNIRTLREINNLKSDNLRVGQKINIPKE